MEHNEAAPQQDFAAQLISEQRFVLAIVAGVIAAIVAAVAWAWIANTTGYVVGWVAVGVGALVGLAVRVAGNGVTLKFGIVAGVLGLIAIVLGNGLLIAISVAEYLEVGVMDVITSLTMSEYVTMYKETFEVMDLLFMALGVGAAFKLAFRDVAAAHAASAPAA